LNKLVIGIIFTISFLIPLSYQQAQAVDFVNLSGHIEDENGDPVIAIVFLQPLDPGGGGADIVTDSNGDYSLDVSSGNYELGINDFGGHPTAPSSFRLEKTITLTEDTIHEDIVLPFVILSGTVKDDMGNPVQGVMLSIQEISVTVGEFTGGALGRATTDVNGFYSAVLFPGTVDFIAVEPMVPPTFGLPGFDIFSDTTLDITLETSINLSGHIEDENGDPVIAIVFLQPLDPGDGGADIVTDSNVVSENISKPGRPNVGGTIGSTAMKSTVPGNKTAE